MQTPEHFGQESKKKRCTTASVFKSSDIKLIYYLFACNWSYFEQL